MTEREIEKLEAGPDLDALVAERVMGWKRIGDHEPYRFHKPNGGCIFDSGPERFPDGDGLIPKPWHPSTDISAAWQVVEKMSELGFWCRVQSPFAPGLSCHAGFTPHGTTGWNGRPDYVANESTIPLSICIAALLAKMGIEEHG